MESRTRNNTPLRFAVNLEGNPERPLEIVAYAFSPDGTLLTQSRVENNQATLSLAPEQASRARIIFGPDLKERKPSLKLLERIGYEPARKVETREGVQLLAPIPEVIYRPWWLRACRVRGQVVTESGLGVWGARVHIMEVDRIYLMIPRLPIDVLIRFRDELLHQLREPIIIRRPLPEPDPAPFRRPGQEFLALTSPAHAPSAERIAARTPDVQTSAAQPSATLSSAIQPSATLSSAIQPSAAQPGSEQGVSAPSALSMLSPATLANLQSDSDALIRQGLMQIDRAYLMPFLCARAWFWPHFLHADEITAVETDVNGRFDTPIFYVAGWDHPDLYFWVESAIGGVWTTVYRRPMACDTHWEYVCGSEVQLVVTDPRVQGVSPAPTVPGRCVAVLTVGNNQSVSQIQTAGAGRGLSAGGCPFGGSLEPHVWFGADVRALANQYRWSYRRLGSTEQWRQLTAPVVRHYGVMQPDATVHFRTYPLGPVGEQSLFEIQPLAAPEGGQWAPEVDARMDTASGFFRSHELGDPSATAGLYELKLELFKNGAPVNLQAAGIQFVVPEPTQTAPFQTQSVGTVPAPEVNLIRDSAGNVQAFRLMLYVDNNPCQAEILPPTIGGQGPTTCGFIRYQGDATVQSTFIARHPHDFADFDFRVNRAGGALAQRSYGPVGPAPTASWNGYTRTAESQFSGSVAVTALLPAGCTKAACVETLYVWATVTDGWNRLSYLDRNAAPQPFAVEPAPVSQA